jgi:hypothetical protein
MQTNASIDLTDREMKSERDFMLCIFFLIQKLKNKTLKSTSGEIDPARESVFGEIWHREIPSRERFSASFGNIRRERALPSSSGREIPSKEIFWREMDSGERERFSASFGNIRRERALPSSSGREIPSKEIFWREMDSGERERDFPAKSGRDSVERRTTRRPPERERERESEICRRDPAKIPSRDYRASKTKREREN